MLVQSIQKTIFAALFCSAASAIAQPATQPAPDGIILEHGKYTRAYQSDWSKLPTGDQIARRDISKIPFKEVMGEDVRKTWQNQERVELKDLHLKVKWNREKFDKKETTLFHFDDVKEVVIDNLSIMSADGDYRHYHSILIEGAERVIIRNAYLAGAVQSYHLRIEGCKDVFIDNVEIAGVDYYKTGKHRLGGGIWINNGDNSKKEGIGKSGMYAKNPKLPGWQVVQNCYIHDGTEDDNTGRNQDGILIHSPGDGLLFNCVVENWLRPAMDASFDIGFRRVEPEYQDRLFRVERNIVKNATFLKTPGATSAGPNITMFVNNQFINTQYADYHKPGTDVHFLHNTFIFDLDKASPLLRAQAVRGSDGFSALWNTSGRAFVQNCLLYKPSGNFFMFYMNAEGAPDKYRNFFMDHNLYGFDTAQTSWLRTAKEGLKFKTIEDWKKETHQDGASRFATGISPALFADYAAGDYRPRAASTDLKIADPALLTNADKRMTVTRDFNGAARTGARTLVPGAFCAVE